MADRVGVAPSTVTNWELNRTGPALHLLPRILDLISFDPSPTNVSVGDRLKAYRLRSGLLQEPLARLLGVDPSTLSRWERNLRVPAGGYARLAQAFLEQRVADSAV